jgi:hypothetical protein
VFDYDLGVADVQAGILPRRNHGLSRGGTDGYRCRRRILWHPNSQFSG